MNFCARTVTESFYFKLEHKSMLTKMKVGKAQDLCFKSAVA